MLKNCLIALLMVGVLSGCKGSREAEKNAYIEGCRETARMMLQSVGLVPDEAKMLDYCTKQANEYLQNNK
jgi:Tfp pilus assembly protein PilP